MVHSPTTNPLAPFPGTPSLPPKIVQRILSRDYFDLADLLPDQLQPAPSAPTTSLVILPESSYATQRRKRRQIPDIATWVQVYSTYILVLASSFPEQLTELIAYQLLIVQHSRRFDYPSWLRYDIEFRQWAAQNKFYQWSQIHPQYYAFAFTAQGKTSSWCPVCYTDGGIHSYDCPKFALPPPNVYRPQRPTPYAQQFALRPQAPTGPPAPKRSKPEHCIL